MKICILENDADFADQERKWLLRQGEHEVRILRHFDELPALLAAWNPNLILADVLLDGNTSSVDLFNALMSNPNSDCPGSGNFYLIYVSQSSDYMRQAFGENVLGYLSKPNWQVELKVLLEKLNRKNKAQQPVTLKVCRDTVTLPASWLVSVELEDSVPAAFLKNRQKLILTEESLSAVSKKLPNFFVQFSRNGFINLYCISSINRTEHTASGTDGKIRQISRRRWTAFLEAWLQTMF